MTEPAPATPSDVEANVPGEFPQADADQLKETAKDVDVGMAATGQPAVYEHAVDELTKQIQALLGNPHVAKHRALVWGNVYAEVGGATTLRDLATDIAGMQDELVAYWEGPGYDSFSKYAERVINWLNVTADRMAEIGQLVANAVLLVFRTYAEAVRLYTACVKATVNVIFVQAASAINDMIGAVGSAVATALDLMGTYASDIVRIEIAAAQLPNPAKQPDSMVDTEWTPRPASSQ